MGRMHFAMGLVGTLFLARTDAFAGNTQWPQYVCAVGDQDGIASCTGWAVGYYVKTIMEAAERGSIDCTNDEHKFSPSWIYNQIYTNGATLDQAGELVDACGAAPWKWMPYTKTLTDLPSAEA